MVPGSNRVLRNNPPLPGPKLATNAMHSSLSSHLFEGFLGPTYGSPLSIKRVPFLFLGHFGVEICKLTKPVVKHVDMS